VQDYVDDIKPTMKAVGLRFPAKAEIVLELPANLDLDV
jgi:hypothetical protein